jgi:hypothetical protein
MISPFVNQLVQRIRPVNLGTAVVCAARGYGEQRNLKAILATAQEWDADEKVVAMLFGFAPDFFALKTYADILIDDQATPIIDVTDPEIVAAWKLSKLAFGSDRMPCRMAYGRVPDERISRVAMRLRD